MKHSRPHPASRLIASLSLAALASAGSAHAQDAPPPQETTVGDTINDTRATLDRWLEVRRTISKETHDWAEGRELLQSRISLLRRSIEETQALIDKQKLELAGYDQSVAELQAKNDKLKQAADDLEKIVAEMESRTVTLLRGAPQPLVEEVRPLALQLPGYQASTGKDKETDGPAGAATPTPAGESADQGESRQEPEVSLSRRFENVVGVLYLFNKYTNKVDQKKQLITLPDGKALSVDAIYLGTSYGFYVDEEDKAAAAGWPGATGWGWSPIAASAQQVREAVKVYNKDQTAAFISLPAEVK